MLGNAFEVYLNGVMEEISCSLRSQGALFPGFVPGPPKALGSPVGECSFKRGFFLMFILYIFDALFQLYSLSMVGSGDKELEKQFSRKAII